MTGYRYRVPARFRRGRRGGNGHAVIGIAAGVVIAAAVAGQTASTVHHAAARPVKASGTADGTVDAVDAVRAVDGSQAAFTAAVLADLGAPGTSANQDSLAAWFRREWPSWPPGARNNPLDTIQPAPGSWTFNSFGNGLHVQNYPTASEGAQATARTIAGGYYPGIIAALRAGRGLCGDTALSSEFNTWSGNGYSGVC